MLFEQKSFTDQTSSCDQPMVNNDKVNVMHCLYGMIKLTSYTDKQVF